MVIGAQSLLHLKSVGLTKARGSDVCTQLCTQSMDSTKKASALFLLSPHVSYGSSHFRPQGPLPNPSHHRLGGLAFECCGTCGHHTHPVSPQGGPPSRTEGKCEGIGTEGMVYDISYSKTMS